jgi:ABC-type dipeptide/oligopeptide/nickel transport system permease component
VLAYILKRFVYTVVVLVIASMIIFVALRVSPGQPEDTLFNPLASTASKEALRAQFHLDDPIWQQYGIYLRGLIHGDFGTSIKTGQRIPGLLWEYGRNSLVLVLAASLLTYLVAIPFGVLAGSRRDSRLDRGVLLVANLGMSVPNFLLALILARVFATELGVLPLSGTGGVAHLVLPAVVLAAEGAAIATRLVRAAVLEQLGQDYVRTLRAKGMSERTIIWRHVLRNALIPVISLSGLQIGALVGYTAIVEIVFRWPGMARAARRP